MNQVEFQFTKDNEFKNYYANGVWVVNTPKNEVEIYFTMDRHFLPSKTIHEVNEFGMITKEIQREVPEGVIEKNIVCSITLSQQNASDIFDFIKTLAPGDLHKQENK